MSGNIALKGLVSVIGAFLISLGVGFMYLWGIITLYGTSYFRMVTRDATLTEDQTDIVFPLTLLGQAIAMPLVTRYTKKISARLACFLAGIAMFLLTYMSAYSESFPTFALLFGLGNGLAIGIIYILPVGHCFQFFPSKRGIVSAVIIAASGIGTFVFAIIAQQVINPNDLSLVDAGSQLFYNRPVASKFPDYLHTLAFVVLSLVSGGSLLLVQIPPGSASRLKKEVAQGDNQNLAQLMHAQFMLQSSKEERDSEVKNPFGNMNYELSFLGGNISNRPTRVGEKVYGEKEGHVFWPSLDDSFSQRQPSKMREPSNMGAEEEEDETEQSMQCNECPRTRDGPKQFIFWKIFLIIILGANFGLMVSVNYKTYVKGTMDDHFLTTVGAIGAIACGFSRFVWGCILDKSTFKILYWCMSAINILIALSFPHLVEYPEFYLLAVTLAYIFYGGHLGMFPAVTSLIFGVRYGPQIYGILFFAFAASNFVQYVMVNLVDQVYALLFMISGAMSLGAVLMVSRLPLDYDWSDRIRQHNERKRMMAH